MKKRVIIIKNIIRKAVILILMVSVTACGKNLTDSTNKENVTTISETTDSVSEKTTEAKAEKTTEAKAEKSTEDNINNTTDDTLETFESAYQLTSTMEVVEEADGKIIKQTDVINGRAYSLTLNLENAAGYTSEEQLIMCTKVFWYCYPMMYEKMAVANTPVDINLFVENTGYEVAEQWENNVHLHDKWLYENSEDYDCLTHEFAHVIQTDWDGDFSPKYGDDTYLIERFADACRYMYAYDNGKYNNKVWIFQTPDVEDHYSSSNRFWVWIEQTYSNDEIDIFKRIVEQTQIKDEAHSWENWESGGPMWDVIFDGTDAKGKTLEQLWEEFYKWYVEH